VHSAWIFLCTGAVPEIYRYFREAPYTSRDARPVIRLGTAPYALFVQANSPSKTLAEFVSAAR
jgi:tripartite-type tricarboxylate transporter receptor subunit TctC